MDWIKNIIVDIIVTLFIVLAVVFQSSWMWWILVIYSALMLVAKGVALMNDGLPGQTSNTEPAPKILLHLLYFLNVILTLMAGWFYLMAVWILIWLFSYLLD